MDVYQGYRSVIAAMTAEDGMLPATIFMKAVNQEDFTRFLRKLRAKFKQRPLAVFQDNLSVHKAKSVTQEYERLNIRPIFNVGYSPEFNSVEALFSKIKAVFVRLRLNNLVNRRGFNFDKTINEAFRSITVAHCAACVRKSRHLLEKAAQLP